MSATNRTILIVLPLVALIAAFWLLVLGPKREEASALEAEAADLSSQVDQQEQAAVAADAARRDFPRAYRRLVVLGKATPSDDDTSSLMLQLDRIAADAGVTFLSLNVSEDAEAGVAPASAPAPVTAEPPAPAPTPESGAQTVDTGGTATPPPAAPTEASAAALPISATVGPAGLPVMKYSLGFEGEFFRLADFLAGIDKLVRSRADGGVGVSGRLVTIDKFDLKPVGDPGPDPVVSATFEVTTYLTPPDEGATAGADPAGPAPVTEAQPVSGEAPPPTSEIASATTP